VDAFLDGRLSGALVDEAAEEGGAPPRTSPAEEADVVRLLAGATRRTRSARTRRR
jgi:hypothetical protein